MADATMKRGDRVGAWTLTERVYKSRGLQLWRAVDADDHGVAIKLGERSILAREAGILAGLQDPCAVRCVPHLDAEPPYLALAWPEGTLLKDRMRQRAMRVADALTMARDVAGVLARLHASGVFRPALRSRSVVLSDHGPVLLDWSAAWRAGSPATDDRPPVEQDIAALGILVFVVLTQQRAAPGEVLDPGPTFSDAVRSLVRALTGPVALRPGTAREVSYRIRGLLNDTDAMADPPAPVLAFTARQDMGRGFVSRPPTAPESEASRSTTPESMLLLGLAVVTGVVLAGAVLSAWFLWMLWSA